MVPHAAVWPYFIAHLFVCALGGAIIFRRLCALRVTWLRVAMAVVVVAALAGMSSHVLAPTPGSRTFALALTASWTLGLVMPVALLHGGGLLLRARQRAGWAFVGLGCMAVVLTVDGFVIEPRWFVVTHFEHQAPVDRPLRIAVIADLQTDRPGAYDERVFRAVMAQQPDLILFAGDLIQAFDEARYDRAWDDLRAILARARLHAPLGVYAVQGDSEFRAAWVDELEGTGIEVLHPGVQTLQLRDDLDLTGISLPLSRRKGLQLHRPSPRAHVVVGHRPDFALGSIDAELLIAGHTHGGQVQVPGFGPLLTLSNVPRLWAAGGLHQIDDDTALVVSRGIGMERGVAPRVRFHCRPQVVVIDVTPSR